MKTNYFKKNEDILPQSSKFIFCFNKGDLIRRLLLKEEKTQESDLSSSSCIHKLVGFYSFKMFIIHYQSLSEKTQDKADKLRKLFLDTHAYNSLSEYLQNDHSSANHIEIEGQDDHNSLQKSVILTYSKYSNLGLKAKEILISDLEERGSEYLKTNLWNFLQEKQDSTHLLIHFNTQEAVSHFMFLRHQIDNWLSEFSNENLQIIGNKHIVFLVYKSDELQERDVDFLGIDWQYQVIENLGNSCYRGNMEYLGFSTEDIFESLQNKNGRKFAKKMFFKHLGELPLKKHCLDIVRNQMVPVLSHACEGEVQNEYWEIVNNFHRRLIKQIDFSSLKSWEELLFECQVYGSVEDIIVNSGTEIYSQCLTNMIQRLKKHNVIASIVTMGWLPLTFRKQFFNIFLKKISSEFSDLR